MVPYNLNIEKKILAEILLNQNNLVLIFHKLRPNFFYSTKHQYIFEASRQIYNENIEVNLDTVSDRLKILGHLDYVGGIEELINLVNINNQSTNTSIDSYIVLLIDKYIRRKLIKGAKRIQQLASESFDSIEGLFDETEKILFAITQDKPNNNLLLTSEVLLETFIDLEKRSLENKYLGIKSGFFDLDAITQGFQKSDLIIIAGRPSMGKTAFALNLVRNIAELQNNPVIVFSLEMSRQQLIYRFLSRESQVMHSKLRNGDITQEEWYSVSKAIKLLAGLKIYLDDTPNLSLASIRSKLNILQIQQGKIGIIVLDYLQLLYDQKNQNNRVQELSKITRGLKILAKEFDTPVIVLSQLSRNVESRMNKRPMLSDLRESGCVSQDMNIYVSKINALLKINNIVNTLSKSSLILSYKKKKTVSSNITHFSVFKRIFYTGKKLVYNLQVLNNYSLKVTARHQLFTVKGWIAVNELSNYDLLGILDNNNFSKYCLRKLQSSKKRLNPLLSFLCIKEIRIYGKTKCYDLWVPLTNNYIANNYLVHNSIEQDADLVLMLYRESYYDNRSQNEDTNLTEIIITKHRNGPTGFINVLFDPKTLTFENFAF